jgi:hypothetical protein
LLHGIKATKVERKISAEINYSSPLKFKSFKMRVIVFIVDTSASMNQRAYLGGQRHSLLYVAKNAVETFVKVNTVLVDFIISFKS